MTRTAVYPGSFNPPTVAHLDLSVAVMTQRNVDVVVWSLSRIALGKDPEGHPNIEERQAVLEAVAAEYPWLEVQVTDARLLSEIATGFDVLIMGADKWAQINEPNWYGSDELRDAAIAALPELAVAPRPPHPVPTEFAVTFENNERVSSTAARSGAHHLMLPSARASGLWG
jgi:nicotinic acid mononucleotide adenylyltransferase